LSDFYITTDFIGQQKMASEIVRNTSSEAVQTAGMVKLDDS